LLMCPHSEIRTFHPRARWKPCRLGFTTPKHSAHTPAACNAHARTLTRLGGCVCVRALSAWWVRWEGKNSHATHAHSLLRLVVGTTCHAGMVTQQSASDMRPDQRSKCNASDCSIHLTHDASDWVNTGHQSDVHSGIRTSRGSAERNQPHANKSAREGETLHVRKLTTTPPSPMLTTDGVYRSPSASATTLSPPDSLHTAITPQKSPSPSPTLMPARWRQARGVVCVSSADFRLVTEILITRNSKIDRTCHCCLSVCLSHSLHPLHTLDRVHASPACSRVRSDILICYSDALLETLAAFGDLSGC
jgi:hypothetical protein